VARLGGEIVGDGSTAIGNIVPLDLAGEGDLAFVTSAKYRSRLSETKASAVIMSPPSDPGVRNAILTPDPYLYFAKVSQWLNPPPVMAAGIDASASVSGSVASTACVGANVWIGEGAIIGAGVAIGANCSIGVNASIGANTHLAPNVSVGTACVIGANCLIHSGAVIGSDGFGFARERNGVWVKVPQIGRVIIGDDVEIGANTTIDRGALGDTVIGNGVKLDNQIQIAHNVRIGDHVAMAGCVGVAGSAKIGARCTVGGGAIILGHLTIAEDVNVSAGTLVAKSIKTPGTYSGTIPFLEHGEWLKNFSRIRHLDAMADKIRALEQRLAALETKT